MVEVEQPTETRPASYRAKHCVVVVRYCLEHDDLATDALVEAFCQIMLDELLDQVTQMPLPESGPGTRFVLSSRIAPRAGCSSDFALESGRTSRRRI
jgi:hypothetical protein